MKKTTIYLAACSLFSVSVIAADLGSLVNTSSCMKGEILSSPGSPPHTFFESRVSMVRPMTSILTLEKSKDDWRREILPQADKWDQFVCGARQNCQKIADGKNLKFVNSFRLNSSIEIHLADSLKNVAANLDKRGIKIKQVPTPKNAKPANLYFANLIEPRDKDKRITKPTSFNSSPEFINYLQQNSGMAVVQLSLKEEGNNKTLLNYTCMVGFSMDSDGKEMAQKYNLIFYRPTPNTKQVQEVK